MVTIEREYEVRGCHHFAVMSPSPSPRKQRSGCLRGLIVSEPFIGVRALIREVVRLPSRCRQQSRCELFWPSSSYFFLFADQGCYRTESAAPKTTCCCRNAKLKAVPEHNVHNIALPLTEYEA